MDFLWNIIADKKRKHENTQFSSYEVEHDSQVAISALEAAAGKMLHSQFDKEKAIKEEKRKPTYKLLEEILNELKSIKEELKGK